MPFFSRKDRSLKPERREAEVVEVVVKAIAVVQDQETGQVLGAVFLQEKSGEREFHMLVGLPEAQAIELERQGVVPSRPLTHDLLKNNLVVWDIMVQKVVITKLVQGGEGGTFHAEITQQRHGEVKTLDSRPSDAIALALRFGAPIYAVEELLNACYQPEIKSKQEIDEVLERMEKDVEDSPEKNS